MKNKLRYRDLIFVTVIALGTLSASLYALSNNTEVNAFENRPAVLLELPTLMNLSTGEFQSKTEEALADQLPFASDLKERYNRILSSAKLKFNATFTDEWNQYVPFAGHQKFNDHIVYRYSPLAEYQQDIDMRINNMNQLIDSNPGINFYTYYIEKESDVNLETNEKNGMAEYLEANIHLPKEQVGVFQINNYSEYTRDFYKTDHHWNHRGSLRGYQELYTLLHGDNTYKEPTGEVCMIGRFSGAKAALTATKPAFNEEFCFYEFDFLPHTTYLDGEVGIYGNKADYALNPEVTPSYGEAFGGDLSLIRFDYNQPNSENILIFGESFDNPILELIAAGFNNTYSVDLRNYSEGEFDFESFVSQNDIDRVLFIGNIDFYLSDKFNVGVK